MRLAPLGLVAFAVYGCVTIAPQPSVSERVNQVRVGWSLDEVARVCGKTQYWQGREEDGHRYATLLYPDNQAGRVWRLQITDDRVVSVENLPLP